MKEELQNINERLANARISREVEQQIEGMRIGILEDVHERISAYEKKTARRLLTVRRFFMVASVVAVVLLSSWLTYYVGAFSIEEKMVTVTCPLGVKSTVSLPDGSEVTLNGGTTLVYPTNFSHRERRVSLNGEAFFSVKNDEERPFIVSAEKMQVNVLGTRFNVEAYKEETDMRVTLESGKIGLQLSGSKEQMVLSPNQQVIYHKQTGDLIHRVVNVADVLAWQRNELVFDDIPLDEITRKLERCFNVKIDIQTERLKTIRYNGAFSAEDSCEKILSFLITMDNRLMMEKHGNEIIIRERKNTE